MRAVFPYELRRSRIYGIVKRPVAKVSFWSQLVDDWLSYTAIVDTGADYTTLPKYAMVDLGISPTKDCVRRTLRGVGGSETVYLMKNPIRILIGQSEYEIPIGFLNTNEIPPLLGRENCLNLFILTFRNFTTEISND